MTETLVTEDFTTQVRDERRFFDHYQRIHISFPDMTREAQPGLVRFLRPAPGMSFVLFHHLDKVHVDAAIKEQIAYFTTRGLPFEWKVYGHDEPENLAELLVSYGFIPEDVGAVMVLDLEKAAPALLKPIKLEVRRIAERDQLREVVVVLEAVYGEDFGWVMERLGPHLEIPGYLSVYVAYMEGQPASCGWIYYFQNNPFASLWGGSTLEIFRNQGLYTALLAARVQEAQRCGVRYLAVDASPLSQPILAKNGFHPLTTVQGFEWKRNGS